MSSAVVADIYVVEGPSLFVGSDSQLRKAALLFLSCPWLLSLELIAIIFGYFFNIYICWDSKRYFLEAFSAWGKRSTHTPRAVCKVNICSATCTKAASGENSIFCFQCSVALPLVAMSSLVSRSLFQHLHFYYNYLFQQSFFSRRGTK